ncbi:MAG: hypothetical protein IJ650_06665 [Paludibacteraceae bacterium]|nr:hypothetical protein [Paludibacteraceae bacterium]
MKRFCVTIILACIAMMAVQADDFAVMRENLRREVFLGTTDYDETDPDIQAYISNLANNAAKWQSCLITEPQTCLWNDYPYLKNDATNTCKHLNYSLQRLHTMALAWAYPTSPLYHDNTLLYNIKNSLDFLYVYCLNENTTLIGNFWEWRIGMPTEYAAIVSILYEQLTPAQLDHYDKSFTNFVRYFANKGNLSFANQADICRNLMYMGILLGKPQDIQDALNMVKRAFVDETTLAQRKNAQQLMEKMLREQGDYHKYNGILKKEGLYEDGTFIQHTAIPYIGSYGTSMARFASEMQLCFSGTSSYSAPAWFTTAMPLWIEKAFFPAVYKGEMMRMFMGRSNNASHSSHEAARDLGLYIFNASSLVSDEAQRKHIINVCADWYTGNNYYASPYEGINLIIQAPQLKRLLNAADTSASTATFSKMLAAGDRLIHETGKFRFGLAMSSNRIGKFEGFSGNNMSGWYTGDGMTYIYTPDHREHWLRFFSFCNFYRMPGTTVDMISRAADGAGIALFDNPPNAQDHVGGVTLNDKYATAAMSHVGAKSDLVAKKAWFCFDDEIVCLGAGICMSENRLVETIVESRGIDAPYYVDGIQGTTRKCWEENHTNPQYAYIDQVGGYVFHEPCTLSTYIEQNKYISLYIPHGKAPQNASYAYTILPKMTQEQVVSYAADKPVIILSNDTLSQAVWNKQNDIMAINFWKEDEVAAMHSDGAAIVMFRHTADTLHLAVSDPTWKRTTQQITLNGVYTLLSDKPQGLVTVNNDGSQTTITINCADRMGQGQQLILRTVKRMPLPAEETSIETRNGYKSSETRKIIRNGKLYIINNGSTYNAIGKKTSIIP